MELTAAAEILASSPLLSQAADAALATVKPKFGMGRWFGRDDCMIATARLWQLGWLQSHTSLPYGISQRKAIRMCCNDAVRNLREVRAIPGGLIGVFIVQFVLLPYLGELLRHWLFDS